MITSTAAVALVHAEHGSMHTGHYKTHLQMVLALLDSGRLGEAGFPAHGSDAHAEALRQVIATGERVLTKITAPKPPRDCNRHTDCDAAEAKAKELRLPSPEHCHDECCPDCFGD